jgi:hypothetical protein
MFAKFHLCNRLSLSLPGGPEMKALDDGFELPHAGFGEVPLPADHLRRERGTIAIIRGVCDAAR